MWKWFVRLTGLLAVMLALLSGETFAGAEGQNIEISELMPVNRCPLKAEDGVQHLDGIQGLMYARLRSVDNDRVRTSRTRHLLDCLLQNVVTKLKNRELDFLDLFSDLVQYPVTNMNAETMVSLASQVLRSGVMDKVGQVDTLVQEFRIPMDGTFQDTTVNGSSVTVFDLDENKQALHEFIYGQYIPST